MPLCLRQQVKLDSLGRSRSLAGVSVAAMVIVVIIPARSNGSRAG